MDVVLRRSGYGTTHAVRLPAFLLKSGTVSPPVVTRCGVTLRSVAEVVPYPPNCLRCHEIVDRPPSDS